MVIIGDRKVGPGLPTFLIAEAGVNHNGDVERALEMVRVAARAGADAVKFQTFRASDLVSREARKADYQARNVGAEGGQLEMLRLLELGEPAFVRIKAECEGEGVLFLSTPFDAGSAEFLARLGVAAFKIGSGDVTNLPLLRQLAAVGRPLIVSTGMSTLEEVAEAVRAIRERGNPPLLVLHCLSTYPAPCAEYNLRAMRSMERELGVPTGLSDHTLGWEVTLGAVALGAPVIEKHFTLDRSLPGPDHAASLEPRELAEMIGQVRRLESALGDGVKRPMPSELSTREVARKSVVVVRDLAAGSVLRAEDLAIKRPGTGLPPKAIDVVPGRVLRVALRADSVLRAEHLRE
jgi:N,N'-diacetyllegionaminate synthase